MPVHCAAPRWISFPFLDLAANRHFKANSHIPAWTTISSTALAWCDVVADFPRDFDRVLLVTCTAEAPSSATAESVGVTGKHGQCLPPFRSGNDDFSHHVQVHLFKAVQSSCREAGFVITAAHCEKRSGTPASMCVKAPPVFYCSGGERNGLADTNEGAGAGRYVRQRATRAVDRRTTGAN